MAMTFGEAMEKMRAGARCGRVCWMDAIPGDTIWITLEQPVGLITEPWFAIHYLKAPLCVPWVMSHGDILGVDWIVMEI